MVMKMRIVLLTFFHCCLMYVVESVVVFVQRRGKFRRRRRLHRNILHSHRQNHQMHPFYCRQRENLHLYDRYMPPNGWLVVILMAGVLVIASKVVATGSVENS